MSRRERLMASLAAAFSMFAVLLFVCSSLPEDQGGMAVILLAIVITVAMSRIGYLQSSVLYNSKLFNYLGAISLPMYLMQNFSRFLVADFTALSSGVKVAIVYLLTLLLAIALHCAVERALRSRASA